MIRSVRIRHLVTAVSLMVGVVGFYSGWQSSRQAEHRDVSLREFDEAWADVDSVWFEWDKRQAARMNAQMDSIRAILEYMRTEHQEEHH